ncbi:MAG: S8 family serine peptidase, partial [Proteobacteria bacterium]|nr:S8 family serine peptidase [Pseudomonadota bacterium]
MSQSYSRRLRIRALAAATTVALLSAPAWANDRVNMSGLQSAPTHDRFIVKYRDGSSEHASTAALQRALNNAAAAARSGRALGLQHLRRIATGAEVVRSNRKLDRAEAETLMRQLAADPNVEYVEVDQLMQPALTPNDTHYAEYQWHYHEATGGIRADQAWDVSNGNGVVVAVLDTGITAHSDLDANIAAGYDFISDAGMARDGNGRDSNPQDQGDWAAADECYSGSPASNSSWHGTHVTGTVAAVTNNAKGVAGVAYGAKVVPVRVLGKCGGFTSDIVDGITWASGGSVSGVPANANPAEIINMSLGGSGTCSSTYQNAINAAVNRGTTVVVAAGNSNADTANFTPASCNNVIAVASTTRQGGRSSFSNYGSLIDVAAPGSDIASTVNSGSTTPSTESYSLMSGTSMASPHVAGVAALMQATAGGGLTPADIESTLKSTLRAFPTSIDKDIGDGIVDARAAVDASGGGGTLTKGVTETSLSASTGNSLSYTLEVPSGATDLSFVISGGTGDADLYVKYGSAPTDSSYDCRPYKSGNEERCDFASPAAGTWYVRVKAYSSFSGVNLTGNYAESSGAPCTSCTQYTGSLTGSGDSEIEPDGTYYYSGSSGSHQGWLEGP